MDTEVIKILKEIEVLKSQGLVVGNTNSYPSEDIITAQRLKDSPEQFNDMATRLATSRSDNTAKGRVQARADIRAKINQTLRNK